jgi:hypothetical protein
MAPNNSINFSESNDALILPSGTTAQRPSGYPGEIRYNEDLLIYEVWNPITNSWEQLGGNGLNNSQLITVFQLAPVIYGGDPNTVFGGTDALDGGNANSNSIGTIAFNGQQTVDASNNSPMVYTIVSGNLVYSPRQGP